MYVGVAVPLVCVPCGHPSGELIYISVVFLLHLTRIYSVLGRSHGLEHGWRKRPVRATAAGRVVSLGFTAQDQQRGKAARATGCWRAAEQARRCRSS